MPSWELFEEQDDDYQDEVLGYGAPVLSVEAASSFGWSRWADDSVAIDHFGASAPGAGAARRVRVHRRQRGRAGPRPHSRTSRLEETTWRTDDPISTNCSNEPGQSPWIDNLKRSLSDERRAAGAGRRWASGG